MSVGRETGVKPCPERAKKPPVVLQVLPALNSGGVEQGVIDLNAYLVSSNWKSIVVSNGGSQKDEIVAAGGKHIVQPVHSKNPLTMAANVQRLRNIIKDEKVDIVHACSRAPAWSAFQAVKGTRARYMTSCHSAHPITGPIKRLYNSSIAKGELVIAASSFLGDYLTNEYNVKKSVLRVVHRGVSLEKFNPSLITREQLADASSGLRIPLGATVVLLPGRLTRSKGHKFLLDALAELRRPDLFCIFMGSAGGTGRFQKELESYISEKRLDAQVRMAFGYDMPVVYKLATVVVAPTMLPEGFGRVPVEAQAMGVPVITTDHGGTRETVLHGKTGWLVQPGDVEGLAATIHRVARLDEVARQEMAARGKKHVWENFSIERMGSMTLAVYGELLARG